MKRVLPVALLLAFATSAQAQERPQMNVDPADAVTVEVERGEVRDGAPRAATAKVGMDTEQVRLESRASDDAIVQQGPTSTSWWWLVGAIVLAGLIIVAVT